jgi:hypothetical protein
VEEPILPAAKKYIGCGNEDQAILLEASANDALCKKNDTLPRIYKHAINKPSLIVAGMKIFDYIFKNQSLPQWILNLNYACLSAIIVWPFVFYGSIFMFDNPKNPGLTFIWFILINSYPILLLVFTYISFKTFQYSKVISMLIPTILLLGYTCILLKFFLPD